MRIKVNYKISILYRHSAIASCHFPRLLGKARGYVYVCEKVLPRGIRKNLALAAENLNNRITLPRGRRKKLYAVNRHIALLFKIQLLFYR